MIRNEKDLTAALRRTDHLSRMNADSNQQRELAAIADAIRIYQDSLAMMHGVGKRASEEPTEKVVNLSGTE